MNGKFILGRDTTRAFFAPKSGDFFLFSKKGRGGLPPPLSCGLCKNIKVIVTYKKELCNCVEHTFLFQTLFRPESTSKALPTFKPDGKNQNSLSLGKLYVFGVSIFCLLCLPGHSQEIIDKLTEAEEELREQLDGEIREKEYLQECLDETGQILYQLKNNEQRLLEDKDTLLDDLENELQVCIMV